MVSEEQNRPQELFATEYTENESCTLCALRLTYCGQRIAYGGIFATAEFIDFIGTKCPVGDTLIQGVRLQLAGVVRE